MRKTFQFRLLPAEAINTSLINQYIAAAAAVTPELITGFNTLSQSIDARGKQPWVNLSVEAFVNEPWQQRKLESFNFCDVHAAPRRAIIVGTGPAGLFAALHLIESGIKPILIERGKEIRDRRRDLATLNKFGKINPESNYCFGEGGAGTYSDGKLYTRSTKRGDVNRILNLFVHFGAPEKILYESHPHIGTNKLPAIIEAMRRQILASGGDVLFEKKVVDLVISHSGHNNNTRKVTGIVTHNGDRIDGESVILATGHSARDVFQLLHAKQINIEPKPFALGVRLEHPQDLINQIQYHCQYGVCDPALPPASYSVVQQVENTGVFSFCMCPGGIIAPASTNPNELVVNGWSPSKRNNPYANSGMVVQVTDSDLQEPRDFETVTGSPKKLLETNLGMMYFQQYVEQKAYQAGGGNFVAPAQRLVDFCENKLSADLPVCSYQPGIATSNVNGVLPAAISRKLREAFKGFGRKMKGFYTNDAVLVATESRTSSPVRIPRNQHSLQHPQVENLYPCGEGAGYAGGIVSAAMDGERVAAKIAAIAT